MRNEFNYAANKDLPACFIKGLKWVRAYHRDIKLEWNENELIVDVPMTAEVIFDGKRVKLEKGQHILKRVK